jgi:hypothetical protein
LLAVNARFEIAITLILSLRVRGRGGERLMQLFEEIEKALQENTTTTTSGPDTTQACIETGCWDPLGPLT